MLNKEPEKINPNNNSLGINFKNSKKIENYIIKSHYKWVDDVVTGPVLGDTLVVYVDNSRVKKIVQLDEQNLIINIEKNTKISLKNSLKIARDCHVSDKKIVLDPAIGFFRKAGKGKFFTKIKTDWVERDLSIIKNLNSLKMKYPVLISVSNKSLIGNLLQKENPSDRLFGSITAEAISVLNGADIIRTHNVGATLDAITIATKLSK